MDHRMTRLTAAATLLMLVFVTFPSVLTGKAQYDTKVSAWDVLLLPSNDIISAITFSPKFLWPLFYVVHSSIKSSTDLTFGSIS